MIPSGFEPETYCLEGSCSIQLSYGTSLAKKKPRFTGVLVGVAGFEPTTSCSQSRRDTWLRYTPKLIRFRPLYDVSLMLEVGLEPLREPPVERMARIELASPAWKAGVISHYTTSAYWSGRPGSNRRPQPWQGCALPTELLPQVGGIRRVLPTGTSSLAFARAYRDTI